MTARHAPPPAYPSRVWLTLMSAAVAGMIVPPTVLAAHAVAPHVAADEHLALTPERSPEPTAHGGPLALPLIGAVTSDPPAYLPPVGRTTRPTPRPVPAVTSVRPVSGPTTVAETPSEVRSPETTPQAAGEALTPSETASETSGSPTETAETPTTTETASETATETTPSDPLGDLIDDVTGTTSEETP